MTSRPPSPDQPDEPVRDHRLPGSVAQRARWVEVLRVLSPGLVLVLLGSLGFLVLLDAVREQDDLWRVDQPVLEWLAGHRSPALTSALTIVTTVFGPVVLPIVVAAGCGLWAWRAHEWRDPVVLAGAMVAATILSSIIKALVGRPRPGEEFMTVPGVETSFSFPSGHTIGAATLVLVGGYLLWSRRRGRGTWSFVTWAAASTVVIVVVAGSRLYLGYHFVTDVLAGVCLAVVVLGLVVALYGWLGLRAAGQGAPQVAPS